MTTFEHGKAPAWACATWEQWGQYLMIYEGGKRNGTYATEPEKADRICRALSLAKLAEDWGKAERKLAELDHKLFDPFVEFPESKAACAVIDAARAALLKACAE